MHGAITWLHMISGPHRKTHTQTHVETFFNPFPVLLWLSVCWKAGKFECVKAIIHVNAANNFSQRLTLVFLTLAKCKDAF